MATRRPLLAGNWKMHGTRSETERLLSALTQALGGVDPTQREIVVAPPFSVLETAARLLADTPIRLAAQNLHWEPHGAFTGEVSGPMLKEAGCAYVILGHSERASILCRDRPERGPQGPGRPAGRVVAGRMCRRIA